MSLDGPRDPELLRRYFEALAVNTAGIAAEKTVYDAAAISRSTAVAYERLLRNIEIKSSAAPTRGDARHLEWLRERLGERFLAGAVLHTGPRPFGLAERIFALPICTLWG